MEIILNVLMAFGALAAVWIHGRKGSFRKAFRFFTIQSNVFCAAACLVMAGCRIAGHVPRTVYIFKLMGTEAVTVTLLTVLFYLGPSMGYKLLFSGPDLWLHLICPVLALVSYYLFERTVMTFACALLGVLPVVLYGVLYLRKVVYSEGDKRWDDFYGFNRDGKWPVSFAAMMAASLAICLLLWIH